MEEFYVVCDDVDFRPSAEADESVVAPRRRKRDETARAVGVLRIIPLIALGVGGFAWTL